MLSMQTAPLAQVPILKFPNKPMVGKLTVLLGKKEKSKKIPQKLTTLQELKKEFYSPLTDSLQNQSGNMPLSH